MLLDAPLARCSCRWRDNSARLLRRAVFRPAAAPSARHAGAGDARHRRRKEVKRKRREMCGRYAITTALEAIRRLFGIGKSPGNGT
jgi:hypothetical protein